MKFSKYNIIHTTENQEHILFNSLWGSTFVISPSVKQAIESSNPTLLTEEENRLFIKYNALIPDEYNESCIYNHFYMCADKYSFKTTDCLLSLYQYTQCIGIHRIHGIAQKVIDECPILILDIPMYFATVLLFW